MGNRTFRWAVVLLLAIAGSVISAASAQDYRYLRSRQAPCQAPGQFQEPEQASRLQSSRRTARQAPTPAPQDGAGRDVRGEPTTLRIKHGKTVQPLHWHLDRVGARRIDDGSEPVWSETPDYPIRRVAGEEQTLTWPTNAPRLNPALPADEPSTLHVETNVPLPDVEVMAEDAPLFETSQRPGGYGDYYSAAQPKQPPKDPPESRATARCPHVSELITPICHLDLDIYPQGEGEIPIECPLYCSYQPRCWCTKCFTWKASSLCHKPLYFEQIGLERYGHSAGCCVQPVLSAAHFFTSVAFLPFKMVRNRPGECIYSLGYHRPGSCAPRMFYRCR